MRILITGGAGFVGSSLALAWRATDPRVEVVCFDNLRRRGSELNLERFRRVGIEFAHGDVRQATDLRDLRGNFDLCVDASAEPSVLAGLDGSPSYVLGTNLGGTLNCLEFVRQRGHAFVFLSTSRVYSMAPLRGLALDEGPTRLSPAPAQSVPGVTARGIAEDFPVHLPRSLYGASKLASELMVQEYADTYKVRAVINRCGVIAGPGQFGKVDQGVFTLWVAHHVFRRPLRYTGFGGQGKQVRDLLHPADLFDALQLQWAKLDSLSGSVFNLGGGLEVSTSLRELTALCELVTGTQLEISGDPATSPVDVPWYVSDTARAAQAFGWKPRRSVRDIVGDIYAWLQRERALLAPLFGADDPTKESTS